MSQNVVGEQLASRPESDGRKAPVEESAAKDEAVKKSAVKDEAVKKSAVKDDAIKLFRRYHGLSLPEDSISCRNWYDRGEYAFSVVLIEQDRLDQIKKQLNIKEEHGPLNSTMSSPNVLGFGVWPRVRGSYVPSGIKGEGEINFEGLAMPLKMFSCKSETGDWLHVDLWRTGDGKYFLRFFTSWT